MIIVELPFYIGKHTPYIFSVVAFKTPFFNEAFSCTVPLFCWPLWQTVPCTGKSAGNLYLDISVIPLVGNDPDSTELMSLTWSHFILVFRCLLWLLRRQITSRKLQREFH